MQVHASCKKGLCTNSLSLSRGVNFGAKFNSISFHLFDRMFGFIALKYEEWLMMLTSDDAGTAN